MSTELYACRSTDELSRSRSSSGGVYPLLAREIIRSGGAVFAACYDETLSVVHRRITDEEGIEESQGSKYVESHLGGTFRDILGCLSQGQQVLFVGTPCQCAGLESFLDIKNMKRDNILIVDFVCHGICARAAWNSYRKSAQAHGNPIEKVNMRDKSTGWSGGSYAWKTTGRNGEIKVTPQREVPYMKAFLSNLILRPSCYECTFRGIERTCDLTLGDYWGVGTHLPEMDDNKGTSLVLVHTEKGKEAFEAVGEHLVCTKADPEKAVAANSAVTTPARKNPNREEFFRRMQRGEDFTKLVRAMTSTSLLSKLRRRIRRVL